MGFEWDEAKRQRNIECHGVDFVDVVPLFDDPGADVFEDTRKNYGEQRFILLGVILGRLFQIVFTRRGDRIRIISARRGNKREERIYEQKKHHKSGDDG